MGIHKERWKESLMWNEGRVFIQREKMEMNMSMKDEGDEDFSDPEGSFLIALEMINILLMITVMTRTMMIILTPQRRQRVGSLGTFWQTVQTRLW